MPRIVVEIESLANGGEAIGRHQGRAVFVDRAAPGDRVSVEVAEGSGRELRGFAPELVEAGPHRVAPICPIADRCGGCRWMHVAVAAQAEAKERIFYDALERIGGIPRDSLQAQGIVPAPKALGYRRRARLHVRKGQVGYLRDGTHELVELEHCPVLEPTLDLALGPVVAALQAHSLLGRAREIDLVCEGTAWSFALHVDAVSGVLRERTERVVRATGARGAFLLAEGVAPLRIGAPELGSLRPDAFAQVSASSNEGLVEAVIQQVKPRAGIEVLELFAGSGNFTLALAAAGARVLAVDQAGPALRMLRTVADRRGLGASVRILEGDALALAGSLAAEGRRVPVILLDPPRSGCSGLAPAARLLGVERLVYVSCNPATLARDLAELRGIGLRPTWAQPFDLFPQTPHVEGVVRMEKV